jgi:hypothetical protein
MLHESQGAHARFETSEEFQVHENRGALVLDDDAKESA